MKSEMKTSHHLVAEAAVIGCVLLDATLAGELRLGWFFDARHLAIANGILDLTGPGAPINGQAVQQRAGNHLAETIRWCLEAAPSAAGWSDCRSTAEDYARLRQAWTTLSTRRVDIERLPPTASPEDVRSLLDAIEREVLEIRRADTGNHESCASEAVDALFDQLEGGQRPVMGGLRLSK